MAISPFPKIAFRASSSCWMMGLLLIELEDRKSSKLRVGKTENTRFHQQHHSNRTPRDSQLRDSSRGSKCYGSNFGPTQRPLGTMQLYLKQKAMSKSVCLKMIFIITTLLPSLAHSQLQSVEFAAFNSIYDLCGTGLASRGGSTTTAKYGCGWGLTCSSISTGSSQICLPNAALASSIGKACGPGKPICGSGTQCISGLCVGVKTRYNTCGASAYQTAGYPITTCAAAYTCHPVPAFGTQAGAVVVNGETVTYMCLGSSDFLPGGIGLMLKVNGQYAQGQALQDSLKKPVKRELAKRVVAATNPRVCYNGVCTAISRNPTP